MAKKQLQYPGEICRPGERIVEKTAIKIFRPAYVPSIDLGAVQELEKLIRPMKVPPAPRAIPPPDEISPVLVQELKDMGYKNFTLDMTVARTDRPLGIRDLGIVGNSMTVIRRGAPAAIAFNYKINSPENDDTPVVQDGQQETMFEIEELYITNAAAPAGTPTAVIRVTYSPFLIRLRP